MANTKKKSNGRKQNRSTSKRRPQTRTTKAQREAVSKVNTEVVIWVALGIALLLFLSNFGICGVVGNAMKSFMQGMFGIVGYVFPIVLIVIAGFLGFNPGNIKAVTKVGIISLLFVDCCIFAHLLSYGVTTKGFSYFYKAGARGEFCGGITGGFFGGILRSLLGLTGAYIVATIILIIAIVLLTEKSVITVIKNSGQKAYKNVREESQMRREVNALERRQRKEERKAKREERRQAALNDITLEKEPKKSKRTKDKRQDVHEIHIEGIDELDFDDVIQDDKVYKYNDSRKSQSATKDLGNTMPIGSDHATDGEFTPKERVILSEESKKTMARKPFGMAEQVQELVEEGVTDTPKKLASEGKIISPIKKTMQYRKPPFSLLADNPGSASGTTKADLMQTANKLKEVLANFGVKVEVTNVSKGPSVTRYELQPELGTKVSRITGLADDIKLNMAAADIRIEAPIPGKAAVGIEIPNQGRDAVYLKELLKTKELREHKSKLAFPAGKDIAGRVVVADIAKMPHMLIAGTTGSGKSVFTNSILMSILYRTTPEEVRLIVIDPKVVEFQVYDKIPHLLYDVVTDPKKAAGILNWAVAEMTTRYKKFANAGVRDLATYNAKAEKGDFPEDAPMEKMPQILIIIDELADLMMVAAKEVEEAICRLAQLARAAGIHMVIATQRPSVDVITGLIKANIPSRVALTVASGTDSRTIIDMNGAEKLLGNGDMLFYPAGYIKPVRLQGAYVSDKEIHDTVAYIKENSGEAQYDDSIDAKLSTDQEAMAGGGDRDPIFADAGRLCIEKQKGSTSMVQRQFKVGFNRAARVMEQLYDAGVVGQEEINKPRKVIMSMEEFEELLNAANE